MTQTPDNESGRVRWTDKMLDSLASDVSELRASVSEVRESILELRESISEVRDSVDGVRITAQALLQIAAQQQQENEARKAEIAEWKEESNRRFYTLLDEVRYLNRRGDRIDGDSQG
ncbi:hypothetical protein [Argonema antarcticum]|uniref:hypothetical protein n=1 Tax=Argonema antarcticum TaxID=2942763 RepID=UPI00201187AC|nr:hypothetical protein [Argonema antarcticum]MCL1475407.1 hypothetical protein [Argonema antarcticum A004/B2]